MPSKIHRKEEEKVEKWNRTHPISVLVDLKLDNGKVKRTRTRTHATLLSGHSAVIWLHDVTGCYSLDRVTVVDEKEAAHE